jgi:hypothetical protein
MIVLYDPTNNNRVYFGTDTRAAAILFGAALAAALTIYGPVTKWASRTTLEAVGIAGAVVLAIAWTRLDGQSSTLYRGGFLVCGLAATAIIAAAVHPEPGPIARVLSLKWLCALGLISYGVYLYHWPIDVALNSQRAHLHGWALFLLQTAITLTVAFASYKLIEQPIRHGALSSIQWRTLTPTIAAALALALFAATSGASTIAGPAQLSSESATVAAATAARRDAPPGARRVLIVGNSVAYSLIPGFQRIRTDPPITVYDAIVLGCVFPPEIIRAPIDVNGHAVNLFPCHPPSEEPAVKAFRPSVAFWIMPTRGWLSGKYHGRPIAGCSPTFNSVYEHDLRQEIERLGAYGAKVVVTTAPYSRRVGLAPDPAEDNCENRMRRTVAAETGAQLVDLFSYICPHSQCRDKQNGVTLRPDGLHFDGPGGDIVARWLIDQVRFPSG